MSFIGSTLRFDLVLNKSEELTLLAAVPLSHHWLKKTLEYGIECYAHNFGSESFGIPGLKLYQQYNMRHSISC